MIKNNRFIKNFLLEKDFQFKLLGYFISLFFLTSLSLYGTTFLFFWRLKKKALDLGIPEKHVFFSFLENQKTDLDLLFIFLVILNFLLLIGVGIIVSHRIAGPLFKLKRHLREFSKDSPRFRLRKNDFFKDLEPVIDELEEKLK